MNSVLNRGQLARSIAYELPDGDQARIFIEVFFPPPHLLIFGGVHIAVPLVTFAKTLGFRVILADPRTTFANSKRFPNVDQIIPESPQEALKQITIGPSTYCVILTHDPKLDEPALEGVLIGLSERFANTSASLRKSLTGTTRVKAFI